jgi:hypothetical protein
MITWKLVNAPDYEFRADSITPYTGAPTASKPTTTQTVWDAHIQFQNSNATQHKMKNTNHTSTTLYYNVKVYQKSTGVPIILDPAIMNDA